MLLDELLILEHVSDSGRDWDLSPGLESLGCVLNCGIELGLGGLRDLSDQFLGGLFTVRSDGVSLDEKKISHFILKSLLTGLITSYWRLPWDSTHFPLTRFLYYTHHT